MDKALVGSFRSFLSRMLLTHVLNRQDWAVSVDEKCICQICNTVIPAKWGSTTAAIQHLAKHPEKLSMDDKPRIAKKKKAANQATLLDGQLRFNILFICLFFLSA